MELDLLKSEFELISEVIEGTVLEIENDEESITDLMAEERALRVKMREVLGD